MYHRISGASQVQRVTETWPTKSAPCLSSRGRPKIPGISKVSAAWGPQDVVQECLTALRKTDIERFEAHVVPSSSKLGAFDRRIVSLGGKEFIDDGPLALFTDVLDAGARRVLPAHLLRRSQSISALQTGPSMYIQRTAVTARSGEEAVLEWTLAKQAQRWWVSSATRDPATDFPLPQEPHPRCSPESVTLAILAALQHGDVQEAVKFFMWPGGRAGTHLPFLLRSFQGGSRRMLLHHEKADLGSAVLASPQLFTQEVKLILSGTACNEWDRADATFLVHMCMRDNGNWMCRDIEWAA